MITARRNIAFGHEHSPWVCLFTQPRNEKLAFASLADAGLEPYLPLYRTFVTHARRRRVEVRPLFSRYIFARSENDPDKLRIAYRVHGVSGYAGKTFTNSLVRDDIVDALRGRETEDGLVSMNFSNMTSGQKVKLLSGPFAGFEAIFEEIDDQRRCWIFLEFLGKLHRKRVEIKSLEIVS